MKILMLITGLGVGGAEKLVVGLADSFAKDGHSVMIVYITGEALILPVNPCVRVVNLGVLSKIQLFNALFRFRRLILTFKPDVIHSHMVHANILARLVRLIVPIPRLISTAHNSYEGGIVRVLAYRMTNWLADQSTNVSDNAVLTFVRSGAVKHGQMMTVHNGISTDSFTFCADSRSLLRRELLVNESTHLLLAVGRLEPSKDYPNLLKSLTYLVNKDFDFVLFIAGDGQLRNYLEVLVDQLGLTNQVRFLGVRHDVAALMSAADIFVMSSAWEGFPITILEAMANQRVIVATDCGGIREAVEETAYLVRPRDPVALAQGLRLAMQLTNKESAVLGRAACLRVQSYYSLDAVVDKWLSIYTGNGNLGACQSKSENMN